MLDEVSAILVQMNHQDIRLFLVMSSLSINPIYLAKITKLRYEEDLLQPPISWYCNSWGDRLQRHLEADARFAQTKPQA